MAVSEKLIQSVQNRVDIKFLKKLSFASLFRDATAGAIASLVTVVYCISFSALIFQGEISDGLSLGLAALLTGSLITGLIVSATTTLAPADAGPDTPAVAVMGVLAASVTSQLSAKGMPSEGIIIQVMIAITIATLLAGVLLFILGSMQLGVSLRFIPYPVIGGFLAASGWLLISGGIEVMTDVGLQTSDFQFQHLLEGDKFLKLSIGLAFAVFIFISRKRMQSYFVLPSAFFLAVTGLDGYFFGPWSQAAHYSSWFISGQDEFRFWLPFAAISTYGIDWQVMLRNSAEIGAVCGVTAISMLLDISSLEVAKGKSADLDTELRTNGSGNIIAALFGGVVGNLSLNGSVLIEEAGAVTRLSGMFAALFCGLILIVGSDVASLVPKPVLGGLLVYLGFVILNQALLQSPTLRSWTDLMLAIAIMLVIVYSGYLLGVALGLIGACLMFAFNYGRIGVVRRHLTRSDFSSIVERSAAENRTLRENGDRVHVFWLSGFIFFGSSNGLFERIRTCIDNQKDPPIGYIILDFTEVTGVDTSAMLSLVKLKHYCEQQDVKLVLAGLSDNLLSALKTSRFSDRLSDEIFATRNDALEWCEISVLGETIYELENMDSLEEWFRNELGEDTDYKSLTKYFERSEIGPGEILYEQGSEASTIDLITRGCVAITIGNGNGDNAKLRRMHGRTVVGEMGFYRNSRRTANVVAEEATIAYRLSKRAFQKMERDDPKSAAAFHQFIIRVLADRLEFANREISALK